MRNECISLVPFTCENGKKWPEILRIKPPSHILYQDVAQRESEPKPQTLIDLITLEGTRHDVYRFSVSKDQLCRINEVSCNGVFTPHETDKNGLCRIVWRCSHCSETDDNTDCRWVLPTYSRYLSRSAYRSLTVWMNHKEYLILLFKVFFFIGTNSRFFPLERSSFGILLIPVFWYLEKTYNYWKKQLKFVPKIVDLKSNFLDSKTKTLPWNCKPSNI